MGGDGRWCGSGSWCSRSRSSRSGCGRSRRRGGGTRASPAPGASGCLRWAPTTSTSRSTSARRSSPSACSSSTRPRGRRRGRCRVAALAYLVFQVPHSIYHWGADARLGEGDQLLSGITLALGIGVAVGVLALSGHGRGAPAAPRGRRGKGASADAENGASPTGRLGPPPRGLLARAARAYGRRRFGRPPATVEAYLHVPTLLMGYGTFETAVERSKRVDQRLKALAELKAGAVVGCEWCMDFGSWLSRGHGVSEQQLRELPRHRQSDAFSEREKLVLDYATAMTRTPPEVDDELFERLREHFADAEIVELTNAIAIENHRARFNNALGLDAQGYSEGAFCVVPERDAAAA